MKQKKVLGVLGLSEKEEGYIAKIFSLLRQRENLIATDRKMHFNNTELRMISEIIAAQFEGKRLISTQLAVRLGITRSAVSQIVNRLEERGVLKRVPDEIDRKIAYIEISADIMQQYGEDVKTLVDAVKEVVAQFGEENFNKMCKLFEEFQTLIQKKYAKPTQKKKKNAK